MGVKHFLMGLVRAVMLDNAFVYAHAVGVTHVLKGAFAEASSQASLPIVIFLSQRPAL